MTCKHDPQVAKTHKISVSCRQINSKELTGVVQNFAVQNWRYLLKLTRIFSVLASDMSEGKWWKESGFGPYSIL